MAAHPPPERSAPRCARTGSERTSTAPDAAPTRPESARPAARPAARAARAARAVAVAALALCLAAGIAPAQGRAAEPRAGALPPSALAVRTGDGRWIEWWRSSSAPTRWDGPLPLVAGSVRWTPLSSGVELGELRLSGSGEAWRLGVVLVRLDPRRVRFDLARRTRDEGTLGAWSVDSAPESAVVALNAGQFSGGRPWGWVVHGGSELQAPGDGPLSMALVVDGAGLARLLPADSIAPVRARGGIALAFQSYPTILWEGGEVPWQLRAPELGVDVGHRDSRLAVGLLADGRLLIALTRFEGLGGVLTELPFGPTAPEMSAIMGALGARSAVLLDGGLSGQLLVRAGQRVQRWRGLRRVPLALLATPR